MLNMKNKVSLLFLISILFLNFSLINAFEYDQSSLREEITEISIHMFLDEGNYHLVIDNTGYVSGEYDREDTVVKLEIFALDADPEYVNDTRSLPSHYYWDIPITTEVFLIFTIHFVFNITATNPVTVFLTDEQGYLDFEEEVENFDFKKPTKTFLIIGIIIGVIFVAGIIAGYIEKIRKKDSGIKEVRTVLTEEKKKPTKLDEITEVFHFCDECNVDYTDALNKCPNCGKKLKKIKRKLGEV